MILDQLAHWRQYAAALAGSPTAFRFLETLTSATPEGRYELEGDRIYCLVQRYQTRPDNVFEAHRRYADVQFLIAGRETILWAPLADLTVTQPYEASRDVEFFARPERFTPVRLAAGQFAVFFPDDGHAPGLEWGGPADVVKAVVKVRVS
jgi:YhcH/YjgK/YiaL family protein